MTYASALETRTTENGTEAFGSLLRTYIPDSGWVWGTKRIARALDLNERYLVNSATPGFFIAVGVNTVCPVSSWDPRWGRDRILLTHINSLGEWWGNRDDAIYLAQIQRAGAAGKSNDYYFAALATLGRTDQSSGSVLSPSP